MLKRWLFLTILIFAAAPLCTQAKPDDPEPTLYIAASNPNSKLTVNIGDVNLPRADEWKIVIATHGWIEFEPWPKELAQAIRSKIDANEWLCGWFDWRKEARVINPRDAALFARDTAGKMLAEQILKLSKNPKHVHLIGHSAGCWAISEAAKILAKQTNASIHLTFLDAYVPLGWNENELGNLIAEPNTVYWADHYLTQDITLKVTDYRLTHAHNVDIGDITPGIKSHRFPFYWYPATVLGKYATDDKYDGEKLYYKSGDIEYGFARSLEAGSENWKESLKLKMGNTAVKIKKQK
jgi:hypothetical protein